MHFYFAIFAPPFCAVYNEACKFLCANLTNWMVLAFVAMTPFAYCLHLLALTRVASWLCVESCQGYSVHAHVVHTCSTLGTQSKIVK